MEAPVENIRNLTAVQSVCAWPNLQINSRGEVLAFLFNQPCHGIWEGDLDCWASTDNGETWRFRGRPSEHEPGNNRMNCAAGILEDESVLVLCSGWTGRGARYAAAQPFQQALPPRISRSGDAGKTWDVLGDFPSPASTSVETWVPFGNIRRGGDERLAVSCYKKIADKIYHCGFFRSADDGRSWKLQSVVSELGNETDILHLGEGRWIASSREETTRHVELLRSDDDGQSWRRCGPLTLPEQHTSHLMRLRDGRILLSYGNRCRNNAGVEVRVGDQNGGKWGPPIRLAHCPSRDCGYPSTVQLGGTSLLTAYYTQISGAYHYEMRAAVWDLSLLE